jgi:hypothetical protein
MPKRDRGAENSVLLRGPGGTYRRVENELKADLMVRFFGWEYYPRPPQADRRHGDY